MADEKELNQDEEETVLDEGPVTAEHEIKAGRLRDRREQRRKRRHPKDEPPQQE